MTPFRPDSSIRRRAGLAPLELVLVIPILMMMLALMIIVGTAGAWKVRTLANSRQAAARDIWPRDSSGDPKPSSWWPGSARMQFGGANPSPFAYDPFASHDVVRGPSVGPRGAGTSLRVIQDTLDITQGLHAGRASIDRDLPIWRQLPYRNRYTRDTQIFSGDQWQHGTMGMSTTNWRRVLLTYEYNLAQPNGSGAGAMQAALGALQSNLNRPALGILDRDDELRSYYGDPYDNAQDRYDWLSVYPAAGVCCDSSRCSMDLRTTVDLLIIAIDGVPCDLGSKFKAMYEEQLQSNPNGPGAAGLQQKIDQLDQFLRNARCDDGSAP